MHSLEQRLVRIELSLAQAERRASTWRLLALCLGGVGAVAGVAAFAAAPAAPLTADVIRAKRLEIVGEGDKVVLLAAASANGGQLDVWSGSGANTVRVSSSAAGGDLALWNEQGQLVAGAYATGEGGRFEAARADGSPGFIAGASKAGAAVSVRGPDGAELIFAGNDERGAGMVRVADAKGATAAAMVAAASGGMVETRTRDGNPAALLGADPEGRAGLVQVTSSSGKPVFSVDVREDGSGRMALGSGSGVPNLLFETGAQDAGSIACITGGKRVVALGCGPQGGLFNLAGLDGRAVIVAGAVADGQGGALSVRGPKGEQLVKCGVDSRGDGEIAVYSATGTQKRVLTVE